jgi:hypothetical protein
MVDILPARSLASPPPEPNPIQVKGYGHPAGFVGDTQAPGPIRRPLNAAFVPRFMEIPDRFPNPESFAPTLHPEGFADPPGVPDPIRTGREEPKQFASDPQWDIRRGADLNQRRTVETSLSTGWYTKHDYDAVPFDLARVPEAVDVPDTRPTQRYGPNSYLFVRGDFPPMPPPRTGQHFSLADHRRITEIMGQRPHDRLGVNTYRVEPQPWDTALVVGPPLETQTGAVRASSISGNRSYRAKGATYG